MHLRVKHHFVCIDFFFHVLLSDYQLPSIPVTFSHCQTAGKIQFQYIFLKEGEEDIKK